MYDGSFDLSSPEFMMAFGLEGRYDHAILNDPRIVRWGARLWTSDNGPYTQRQVKMRACNKQDYEKFFPPEPQAHQQVDGYKYKEGSLFCIDWAALSFELYGSADVSRHQSIDIEAQSCSTHVALFGKESEDEPDCIDDFAEVLEYFHDTAFIVYSNEGRFAPENFDDPIHRISTLKKRQIDETSANWYNTHVQEN